MVDLIVYNTSNLITMANGPRRGSEMKNINSIEKGWFAVTDGKFSHVGSDDYDQSIVGEETLLLDAQNSLITPGLVDAHTHLVHGGSREHELKMKLEGVPYLDILKAGGGILSTVQATRAASADELLQKGYESLNTMLKNGVTTVEAKSGYGLNLETELKQLEVAKRLNDLHPSTVVSTFLGAHAIPKEFKEDKQGYIKQVKEMIDYIEGKDLATFVDIFCEDAVFNPDDSRDILTYAISKGFKTKIHADEIVDLGGAKLATEIGCVSADHLMATGPEGIKAMANSDIVANLLVGTSFNLNKDFAKGRDMIDAGCYVAVSTDFNPGSCPSENLPLVMYLAASKVGLLPEEVLCATTINAAKAVGLEDSVGSIEVGKNADFVIYNTDNLNFLFYNFGKSHVRHVFKNGNLVVANGEIYKERASSCGGCSCE
ncbi:MAG: imidazolonepropionase [Bacilli bacterium]